MTKKKKKKTKQNKKCFLTCLCATIINLLAQTKVSDANVTILVQKNVLRLDIAIPRKKFKSREQNKKHFFFVDAYTTPMLWQC